jgi:hypothetical protein
MQRETAIMSSLMPNKHIHANGLLVDTINLSRRQALSSKICPFPQVKSRDSNSISRKHIQYHTKPIQCTEPGCSYAAANRKELRRHRLRHGPQPGDTVYYCPSGGCDYCIEGIGEHFKRKDHANRHIKAKHPGNNFYPVERRIEKQELDKTF